ncbi:serine/threonine-protein phosphatase 6 regulatory ankyrin repeat subunit C-like [Cloeon dipterum]|uniref:serine/threonine-protein phosphatase 6 regulatory ankyrin repeat subunit C-like n=1 Tax=Cloeon dipterum TaxID=197152 RepID=UPI0032207790
MKLRYIEENKGDLPALHFAARISDVDVCRHLVEQGADVNEKCSARGATPLHYAAMNETNGLDLINFFIEKGCDIDGEDACPDQAISYARRSMFEKLSFKMKSLDTWSEHPSNFSMLETACKFGDLEMCKWLLEDIKIDVNQFEDKDWKDRILQTVAGNHSHAEELFKGFADTKIKIGGQNLLQFCVNRNHLDAAKIVHGKDGELINEIDEQGATILHRAARHGNVRMCQWLIDQGQDIKALNTKTRANFLHYAAQNSDDGENIIKTFGKNLRGYVNRTNRLVEQGADVNEKCSARGATPLHYAAMNKTNGLSLIKYFIEKGLDIEVEDAHRDLFIAPDQQTSKKREITYDDHYEKFLKLTLRYVEENKGDLPALHFAARVFDVDVCRRLVEQGADVNEKCSVRGATPLHYAALNEVHGLSLIDYLFYEKGCDIDGEDARPDQAIGDARRMLETACQWGDLEMCKWLLEDVEIDVSQFKDKDWKDQILQTVAGNHSLETNAEELFKGFADTKIKIGGQNLLQFCVNRNHLDAAKIVHGKDGELINEIDEQGATILHRAARHGNVRMCQWLIDQGQDIKALNTKTRANFLHYAAQNSVDGENIIKIFGENLREYVNGTNVHDLLPLHLALINKQRNYKSVVEALLEVGADLSLKIKGYNLLHFCIASKKLDCAKFVHNKNKNLIKERAWRGKTTLQIAADFYDEEIYEWLVGEGDGGVRQVPRCNTGDTGSPRLSTAPTRRALDFSGAVYARRDATWKLRYVEENKGDLPALHFAARFSDVDVCRRLVEQGADVNEKCGVRGSTPLHYAAMNETNGLDLINYFLENGYVVDVDARREKAIEYVRSRMSYAKALFKNESREILSEHPSQFSMLESACEFGNLNLCKWLLEDVGIDVDQFEDKDWKDIILQTVAKNDSFDDTSDQIMWFTDAKELFKGFADTKIKTGGQNLLQFCVNWNNIYAAEIVHGKDGELINEIDEDGATILHRAARHGDVRMCEWLIDQGQDIKALNTKTRANFLHYAAQNSIDGENIIKKFGQNLREYVNGTNVHDLRPLHFALMSKQRNYKSVAEALLEVGADLSLKITRYNFLHFCIAFKKLDSAKFVHAKDKNLIKEMVMRGKTTLHLAADFYDKEIYEWLVEEGEEAKKFLRDF